MAQIISAAATLATQLVTSHNNLRQTREVRSEDRRRELADAIRDFLAEAQDQERTIAQMLKGERSPDANFNELWLIQKMIPSLFQGQNGSSDLYGLRRTLSENHLE